MGIIQYQFSFRDETPALERIIEDFIKPNGLKYEVEQSSSTQFITVWHTQKQSVNIVIREKQIEVKVGLLQPIDISEKLLSYLKHCGGLSET